MYNQNLFSRDFTLKKYSSFIKLLLNKGYNFIKLSDYLPHTHNPTLRQQIILRHDVDKLPENSLYIAEIENALGINGSYYFRIIPESFNIDIVKKIQDYGHEIGYHYEEMDLVYKKQKKMKNNNMQNLNEEDLIDEAYKMFRKNLNTLKTISDIKTICMHGSPLSRFDNKAIWKKYNYKELGILYEPYLDLDWNEWGYLTDTGRTWDNKGNIRDKVSSNYDLNFNSTFDIMNNINLLPLKLMITIHPQRWNDKLSNWARELILQSSKNYIKKFFISRINLKNRNKNITNYDRYFT